MPRVMFALGLVTGLLLVVCWPWGIRVVFRDTRDRRRTPKVLWRLASIFLPIVGFLVYALAQRRRRRDPRVEGEGVGWMPVAAHLLLLILGYTGRVITRTSAVVELHERTAHDYSQEWWQERSLDGRPGLCLAMSGGGIRSAAFNVGVLQALHERKLLPRVDVISSVSGGSYAMSWLLLQQYYGQEIAHIDHAALLDRMFDPQGAAQRHLKDHARQFEALEGVDYYINAVLSTAYDALGFNVVRAISWMEGSENLVNSSANREAYRSSLQQTFQLFKHPDTGAVLNSYQPPIPEIAAHLDVSKVTKVSFKELASFAKDNKLPFFVFNTTLDVARGPGAAPDDGLWPSVFELNGWGLGSDSYGYRAWADLEESPRYEVLRLVNVTPAISGAAVSPVALAPRSGLRILLSLVNADLGYMVPRFMKADRGFLYLSDGGHSENLGAYSLVRRGCRNIIVVDAEHEPGPAYAFAGYRLLADTLRHEMDLTFQLPLSAFRHGDPVLAGTIERAAGSRADGQGRVVSRVAYIKLAMDQARKREYPPPLNGDQLGRSFPQDPTSNQNFAPLRFEAYRNLGHWIATHSAALAEFERALDDKI